LAETAFGEQEGAYSHKRAGALKFVCGKSDRDKLKIMFVETLVAVAVSRSYKYQRAAHEQLVLTVYKVDSLSLFNKEKLIKADMVMKRIGLFHTVLEEIHSRCGSFRVKAPV